MNALPSSGRPGDLEAIFREQTRSVGFVPAEHKLRRPSLRRGVVSRAALIDRIRADDPDILAVSAPPGYGKTTFLADWAASEDRPCAWLTLDATDNDPVLLLTYVAIALDRVERVDPSFVCALWSPATAMATVALPRLARLVADRRVPFVLVLDDVHELVNPEALDVLAVIVAALSPGSTMALVGRARPPLPFGRLRVKRGLVEVGSTDLAMDVTETTSMFRACGLELQEQALATLVERTEGWPAGLYLAARALQREGGDLAVAATRFAGDNRFVADYVRDELLGAVSPEVASFLLDASCLERLSGPFCDAVLERDGSAALLEDLERRSLLVLPLDDRREWYRLHRLLTEALQAELHRRRPDRAREVHRRASHWMEARGDIDAAITHAWRSGDVGHAEGLIYSHVGAYTGQGRQATIIRWLSLFPRDELTTKPLLAILAAHARIAVGDGDGAAHWLERAEAGVPNRRPRRARGWVPPVALAVLRALLARQGAAEMAEEAEYAYRRLPHGDWHALAGVLCGAAEFMLGNEGPAEELLSEAVAEAVDTPTVRGLALAHLAVLDVERGRWDQAAARAREGRAVLATRRLDASPGQFLVTALSCLVEARAGRIAEAEADLQLTRHNIVGFSHVGPWANLQARIALVRADLILGDRVGARTRLDEADGFLSHVPDAVRVKEQAAQLRRELAGQTGSDSFGPSSLTVAELRVVAYLPTHLTLAEIADRLFVSRNTVKTQAIAVYRKLGTSSRAGAVAVARQAGILDDAPGSA